MIPPAIVLGLQLGVGLIVGANPFVMLAAAAAIVAIAYLVQRAAATRSQAPQDETIQLSHRGQVPHAAPIGLVPAQQVEPPVEPPVVRPTSDLRWLWGTIERDPTARPPRRDRN